MAGSQANVDLVIRAKDQSQAAVNGAAASLDRLDQAAQGTAAGVGKVGTNLDRLSAETEKFKDRLNVLSALETVTKSAEGAAAAVERLTTKERDAAVEAQRAAEAQKQAASVAADALRRQREAEEQLASARARVAPIKAAATKSDGDIARNLRQLDALQQKERDGVSLTEREIERRNQLNASLDRSRQEHADLTAKLNPEQAAVNGLAESYKRLTTEANAARVAQERATNRQNTAVAAVQNATAQRAQGQAEQASLAAIAQPFAQRAGVSAESGAIAAARAATLAEASAHQQAIAKATPVEIPAGAIASYDKLIGKVVALVAAYASLQAAVSAVQGVVTAYRTIEATQNRLGALFNQNKEAVGKEMEYLSRTSDRLGLSFKVLADNYGSLALAAKSAGVQTNDTRQIFEALAITSRVNKFSADQMNSAFLAIQQMFSKGKIQAQELTLQLGNVLPGAYSTVARALGKTTAELGEAMQNGEVIANSENMLKIANELKKMYGGQLAEAVTTFTTAMDTLANNMFKAQVAIGDGGLIGALKGLFTALNDIATTKEAQQTLLSIGAAAGRTVDGLTFLVKNASTVRDVLMGLAAVGLGRILGGWAVSLAATTGQVAAFGAAMAGPAASITFLQGRLAALAGIMGSVRSAIAILQGAVISLSITYGTGGVAALAYGAGLTALRGLAVGAAASLGILTAAARTLLVAFGGIPGILATVALYFAGNYFAKWMGGVEDTTAALKEHERVMGNIVKAYDDAADKAANWQKNIKGVSLFDADANFQKQVELRDTALQKLKDYVAGLSGTSDRLKTALDGTLGTSFGPKTEAFSADVRKMGEEVIAGTMKADDFRKKLEELFAETKDPALKDLLREKLIPMARGLSEAQTRATEAARGLTEVGKAAGATNLDQSKLNAELAKGASSMRDIASATKEYAAYAGDAAKNAAALAKALNDQKKDVPSLKAEATRDESIVSNKEKADARITEATTQRDAIVTNARNNIDAARDKGDDDRVREEMARIRLAESDFAKVVQDARRIQEMANKATQEQFADDTNKYLKSQTNDRDAIVNRITYHESGDRADAKNPNSSATGIGQFTKDTWLQLLHETHAEFDKLSVKDRLDMRKDPDLSKEMVGVYVDQIQAVLRKNEVSPTRGNTYLGYFSGPETAARVIQKAQTDPNAPASSVYKQDAIDKNPTVLAGKTVAQVIAWAEQVMAQGKSVKGGSGDNAGMTDDEIEAKKTAEKVQKRIQRQQDTAQGQVDQTTFDASQAQLRKSNNIEDQKQAFINDRVRASEANDPVDRSLMTPEQLKDLDAATAKVKELAGGEYEISQRRKDSEEILNRQLEKMNGLAAKQKELRTEARGAADNGDTEKAASLRKEAEGLTPAITTAADAAQKMASALGDDKALANIAKTKRELTDLKDSVYTAKQGNELFASSFTSAFDGMTSHLGNAIAGTEKWSTAWKGMRNAALGFFTSVLKGIADVIAKQAALKLAQSLGIGTGISNLIGGATGSSGGGGIGAAITGLFAHSGVDLATGTALGPHTGFRSVPAHVFHEATRYHTGKPLDGINPLSPGELPAIIKNDEAVLTRPQMGKIQGAIDNARGMAASMADMAQNPPKADVKVIHLTDPVEALKQAIKDRPGQQVMFDFAGDFASTYRSKLGLDKR